MSNELPIILVSAANLITARQLIIEIINDKVDSNKSEEHQENDPIWNIKNKYYEADVRLHALGDGDELKINVDAIEAHIIHLDENECDDAKLEQRARDEGQVRLVAVKATGVSPSLTMRARHLRYEPVALYGPINEPDGAVAALPRIREALHAHVWPHLRYKHCSRQPSDEALKRLTHSDLAEFESEETDVEASLERFTAALGVVRAASELPREERRDRADALLAAFCSALGYELDDL